MTNQEALEIAKINPELKDFVLSSIPKNLNKIEQSIFVYSKLCSILNYDPEYAASGRGEGPKQTVHKNLNYVEKITTENTDVICYDFNLVFGKILKELDINFKIFTYTEKSNVYGNHSDIYAIFSEKDIPPSLNSDFEKIYFYGYADMKRIKVNHELMLSFAPSCSQEFKDYAKEKSQEFVNLVLEQQKKRSEEIKQFENNEAKIKDLEKQYLALTPDLKNIEEEQAIQMFVSQVQKIDMNRYDASFYIAKLFKNLLPSSDEKICTYSILREKTLNDSNLFNMIGVANISTPSGEFFLKITPPNGVQTISNADLQKAFDDGTIDYIPEIFGNDYVLPAIKSATVDQTFEQSIKAAKKLNSQTLCEFNQWRKEFEGSDFERALPCQRIFRYAKTNCAKAQNAPLPSL